MLSQGSIFHFCQSGPRWTKKPPQTCCSYLSAVMAAIPGKEAILHYYVHTFIFFFFTYLRLGPTIMIFFVCFLEDEPFSKLGQLLKERICSDKSKFFLLRGNSTERGVKRKKMRLYFLKIYSFALINRTKAYLGPNRI